MNDNEKWAKFIGLLQDSLRQLNAPVKNGKPPPKKRTVVKAYKLDYSRRGRVPNWVLKQAKCSDKAAVCKKFKDGHRFTA